MTEGNEQIIETKRREILRSCGSEEILPLLFESLKDSSWRLRKTALDCLISSYEPENYIQELIKLLYLDDNAGARNTAIEGFIRLGKKVLDILIDSFETDNSDVRKFIIDIIGTIGGRETLPLLLKALKDDDDNVRASAIEYLGRLREPHVVDALIEVIHSGDTWTAYPAVLALGKIGDRRAIPALIEALKTRPLIEPALKSLARFAQEDTLRYIVPFLNDRRRSVQEEAIKTIENFYQKGISEDVIIKGMEAEFHGSLFDIILPHTKSKNPEVRSAAILILGILKDQKTLPYLLELLEEPELLDIVKRSLLYIGRSSPEILLELIEKETPHRRRILTEVIAELRNPFFYEKLLELLSDLDGHVISSAATGIGYIGDERAVQPLLGLLGHPYPDIQTAVVEALTRLKKHIRTDQLLRMLGDTNPIVRKNAVILLGEKLKMANTEETDLIVRNLEFSLKDPDQEVRKAVVRAISNLSHKKARSELKKILYVALTDEAVEVRIQAIETLGAFPDSDILGSLVVMSNDPNPNVRAKLARVLSNFKDYKTALECLINLLNDPNGYVVTQSIESLSFFRQKKARDSILKMLSSNDREIQRTAILSLSGFPETLDVVKPFLNHKDWATRLAAVQTLASFNSAEALGLLEEAYDKEEDPTVRKAIQEALGVQ